MKPEYKRENLKITEFDAEDVITTSEISDDPVTRSEIENAYRSVKSFGIKGTWF